MRSRGWRSESPRRFVAGADAIGIAEQKASLLVKIVLVCRNLCMCRRWDSNPHEVALTGFFESDKDCAMVRDAALRGAFMSLFASLCGIVRVLVRPDCHQRCHQNHSGEAWSQGRWNLVAVLACLGKSFGIGPLRKRTPSRTISVGVTAVRLPLDQLV